MRLNVFIDAQIDLNLLLMKVWTLVPSANDDVKSYP